ncbi:hypothetical protein KUTeg_014257 [Tegillarca granosa]|uniref:ABC transmembrane type-1 domain-containing protein n=1 Tax=Tegillarca granosa TaxID=220873 RepID=A0ABQ9EW44_TEGGR|nr:hypothetical protein KUTeg_014257 [Tegillarca granosa]
MDENKQKPKFSKRFDLLFFKRFLKLIKLMFPSWMSVQCLMCVFLLCLGLLEQFVIYNIGQIPSKYYLVFGNGDSDGFKDLTVKALLLIIAEAFIKSSSKYVSSMLYITWRGSVTTTVHQEYFTDILYYDINTQGRIDNPDQRITQDVDKLSSTFSQIFSPIILSPFIIGYYTYHCFKTTGYLGPVGVLVFFLVSTIINKLLMSPVVTLVFKRERREGDFRGGAIELSKTDKHLQKLLIVQRKQVLREYALNFAVSLFDYIGSILSYNSFMIMYLVHSFTTLIDLAVQVATMAGTAHRVGELLEELGYLKSERRTTYNFVETWLQDNDVQEMISFTDMNVLPDRNGQVSDAAESHDYTSGERVISVDNVKYGPPKSGQILCKNLTFHMQLGVNVLITGESGSGKSSLLRVLCGLWPTITGTVSHHIPLGTQGVFYLPQKPYFTDGSLRQQIIYPLNELDSHYSVLDEATSQVGINAEDKLYRLCQELGITVLSVGHRKSLRQYHEMELHLDGKGGWSFQPIRDLGDLDVKNR